MADETTAPETPVPAGTEAEVAETPKSTDPYDGKSVEDLKKIVRDKEQFIGRQSDEIGRIRQLEQELSYLRGVVETPRYAEPAPKAEEPDFDFTDPRKAVERIVESRLEKERRERRAYEGQINASQSQAAFERGKRDAYARDPELFRGIERDVEGALFEAWKKGGTNPTMLADPLTWEVAATAARVLRGERNLIPSRKTMTAPAMERPSSTRRNDEDEPVTWDDEERLLMKRWGISQKEAEEGLREGQQMRSRGEVK